jgi:valyl-tRNA synthetase
LAAGTRAREEEHKAKERELLRRVRAAEEEREMTDLVVQEYADLVRTIEGRQSLSSPTRTGHFSTGTALISNGAIMNNLKDGKSDLQKLLQEFNAELERLESEIGRLNGELGIAEAKMQAEKQSAAHDRTQLAQVRAELEKLRIDDNTSAKMVSRYM